MLFRPGLLVRSCSACVSVLLVFGVVVTATVVYDIRTHLTLIHPYA
jgi:hypothetical protein